MEINEVAAVVMMGRLLYDDEYPGAKTANGKNSPYILHPYNYKKTSSMVRITKRITNLILKRHT